VGQLSHRRLVEPREYRLRCRQEERRRPAEMACKPPDREQADHRHDTDRRALAFAGRRVAGGFLRRAGGALARVHRYSPTVAATAPGSRCRMTASTSSRIRMKSGCDLTARALRVSMNRRPKSS